MFQLYDEKKKKRYPLTGLIKEIGRTSECDVCIPDDDQVSRVHARLDWDGANWVLVDLGSTNGSYVNDQKVTEHRLEPGDVIEIGDTLLRYLPLDVGDVAARRKTTRVRKSPRDEDHTSKSFSVGQTVSKKS
jgi:pSer/pThr/pTyr-binding forkhead associated (FHA) protein